MDQHSHIFVDQEYASIEQERIASFPTISILVFCPSATENEIKKILLLPTAQKLVYTRVLVDEEIKNSL